MSLTQMWWVCLSLCHSPGPDPYRPPLWSITTLTQMWCGPASACATVLALILIAPPFPPWSSMSHDTHVARASLGLCPQQNVLVEHLGVVEHLQLLAAIKGVKGRQGMRGPPGRERGWRGCQAMIPDHQTLIPDCQTPIPDP